MTRLRYGPRFSQHGASAEYAPDLGPSYANTMERRDRIKIKAIIENTPRHTKELWHYKAGTTNSKRSKAKTKPIKDERETAERRMLEAMRKVVGILEFHMEELQRTRKLGAGKGLVNQYAINNVLVLLRTKCGVYFEPNEYDHHIDLGQVHLDNRRTGEQQRDDVRSEREQQRLSRLRNMKAMAEKFIAKHRGTS